MKKSHQIFGLLIALTLGMTSCQEDRVIYELDQVELKANNISKIRQKNQTQFVSVLYTDLFERSISNQLLNDLANLMLSHGDKQAFNEMLVDRWLNEPGAIIPSNTDMRDDLESFIDDTYSKFLGRKPTEMEKFYLKDNIENDSKIDPHMVYAAFILSNEYLFY